MSFSLWIILNHKDCTKTYQFRTVNWNERENRPSLKKFQMAQNHSSLSHIPHEIYMANASPNAREPKETYIPPARVGSRIGHYRLPLSNISLRWALLACIGSARLFRYQHVGIPNAKSSRWGSKPTRGPNTSGFVLQWNIGMAFSSCQQSIVFYKIDAFKSSRYTSN